MQGRTHTQHEVDSMLRRGVLFSIFWLMGVGSLIAVVQGFKAQKIIRESNGDLKGMGKVTWCFIVGGTGLLFWGFVILMVVIKRATT
jgi:hypothetical protein